MTPITYSPDEVANALQFASPATQQELRAIMAERRLHALEEAKHAPYEAEGDDD